MVVRVRTSKALGSPIGTFEIGLTFRGLTEFNRSSLNKVLVPDNMVLIAFDKGTADSTLENVMEGYVTKVFERTTVSDSGKPEREIVVTGMDAGKFLARHEIPALAVSARLWGRGEEAARALVDAVIAGGTVREVATKVFHLLSRLSQIKAATGGAIELFIDPSIDRLGGYTVHENVWIRFGKFWNVLHGVVDWPWNELFADFQPADSPYSFLGAEQFMVVLRRTPFDQEDWDKLPVTTIRDHELRYADTALSDDERVNLVYPVVAGMAAVMDGSADALACLYSLFDSASMKAHGTQPFHDRASSTYANTSDDLKRNEQAQEQFMKGQGVIAELVKLRGKILWRWFSINHLLFKGSWVVKGDPHIHIGTRVENQREPSDYFVVEEGDRRQYYVEQVIQDFNVRARSYFTHLAVTRGCHLGPLLQAQQPETLEDMSAEAIVSGLRGGTVFEGGIPGPQGSRG